MAARAKRKRGSTTGGPAETAAGQSAAGMSDATGESATDTPGAGSVPVDVGHEPTTKEKLRMLGCLLLVVAAIFAITSMEAPFYMNYELAPGESIHRDDSHIGAPWRYFGISILWYISAGAVLIGTASLVCAAIQDSVSVRKNTR